MSDGPATGAEVQAVAEGRTGSQPSALEPGALPPELEGVATRLFGDRLPLARRYARLLAREGVRRGLIGPREVDRLWERHILNCALLAEAVPAGTTTLADVGSGAGLPGVVLAIAREDLQITLVETMLRRTTWLEEVARELDLPLEVVRARAEDLHGHRTFDAVTARAVANLEKLSRWTLPLVAPGGHLVLMKGSSAEAELADARETLEALGGEDPQVIQVGDEAVEVPTTVVRVRAGNTSGTVRAAAPTPGAGGSDRRQSARADGPARSARKSSRGARHGRRPR